MSLPDGAEYWNDVREGLRRERLFFKDTKHKRAPDGKPLCGAPIAPQRLKERVRAKWSKVTCAKCLKMHAQAGEEQKP